MTARSKRLKRKSTVRRKKDPIPWKYCLLTIVCGLFLVCGFFFAAKQHFSSMDYGMKNAKLRKQIEELKTQKRQLTFSREVSISPAEIKKSALKMGLTSMDASNIEIVEVEAKPAAKPHLAAYSEEVTEREDEVDSRKKTDSIDQIIAKN